MLSRTIRTFFKVFIREFAPFLWEWIYDGVVSKLNIFDFDKKYYSSIHICLILAIFWRTKSFDHDG